MNLKYVGKCLLIEENGIRTIVIGDVHIGGESELGGVDVNKVSEKETLAELERVFTHVGKIDKIVLLGDLKHEFSRLTDGERYGIVNLIDYLEKKSKEIIIVKGNHDNYLLSLLGKRAIKIVDYYIDGKYAFLHGDRDFIEIWADRIEYLVMGHMHPAISLNEFAKVERYKCFLVGELRKKKVIIVPSFVNNREGIDVKQIEYSGEKMAWKMDLENFDVKVVGENLEVLDFGKLKNIN